MDKIIYLSGKITGEKKYFKNFKKYEKKYLREGHTVLNPARLPNSSLLKWDDYMKICKPMVEVADMIVMLPDYKKSKGALQELEWAIQQNKEVVVEEERC